MKVGAFHGGKNLQKLSSRRHCFALKHLNFCSFNESCVYYTTSGPKMVKLSVRVTVERALQSDFFSFSNHCTFTIFLGKQIDSSKLHLFSYFSTCYVPVGKFSPKKAKLVFLYTLLVGVVETRVEKGKSCKRSNLEWHQQSVIPIRKMCS